jgi:hypothetical protein
VKIHNVEQGSEEWFNLRLGIPSASRFKDLLTPTGKPSASSDKYLNELLAERLSGKRFETFKSHWMQRGNDLEPEAAGVFWLQEDLHCREIGFVTNDSMTVGCSPDRIVGDGMVTGLEIKCPSPGVHTAYLREYAKSGAMPSEYYAQVQGTMWLMDFSDYWFQSYHPDLPNLIMKVERDEKYIAGLSAAIEKLLEELNTNFELIGEKYDL